MTKSTSPTAAPTTTTEGLTTITRSTAPTAVPPTTTEGTTTTEGPTTTEEPSTMTKSTSPTATPTTTTEGLNTITRSTAPTAKTPTAVPPTTIEGPTTATRSTHPTATQPTTTEGPSTATRSTTSPTEPPTTTKGTTSASTPCITTCEWSEWYDVHNPEEDKSDWETYENIKNNGKQICENPKEIDCRFADKPKHDFNASVCETRQVVTCDVGYGLICRKEDQIRHPFKCFNYKIRVCCEKCAALPTTTEGPTTATRSTTLTAVRPMTTEGPTTAEGPTTTTKSKTLTAIPPTTTERPTTTTKSTAPTAVPPTTTEGTTTTEGPTTTEEPSTITKSTSPTAAPPTTTEGPTTITRSTTLTAVRPMTTEGPTTAEGPTTMTKSTTPTAVPPMTTEGPTTTTKSKTPTAVPPPTIEAPTTATRSTHPTATQPTTTEGPTTATPEGPTTTTTSTTPTAIPPTTTEGPTTVSTTSTTFEPPVTSSPSTVYQTRSVISTQTTPPSETTPSTIITLSSTTQCFCVVNGKHYRPGEVILDMEHIGSGACLTMICSDICEISNKTELCRPTPLPTPTPTPPVPTCPEWEVAQNETFLLCNCTLARCIENNTIEIIPYECPPLDPITCTNGKKPVLVYDENYCCQHYVCDCVCEGWGDPHYITFDGLFYSYQGNCTYVLMEEMLPKHNLKIYIDNVFCDPTDDVSCPRSIIISYRSQIITLKNHNLNFGEAELRALIDGVSLKLPYSQQGVKIMNSGITMVLEISHLKVIITFGITGFSVTLPYQYFGDNTQGHCGTCNNNQADDCMLPGGRLLQSCAVMADYWPASHIYKSNCQLPFVLPSKIPEPPQILSPCKPDSICDLLKSSVFAECHPLVAPDKFYQGCVFDSCHVSNPAVQCTSLQTYAAACGQAGVCVNWRNHTTMCASDCPSNKVYKACGPAEQPTCQDNPIEPTMNFTTEGCFCPDGMKLFNKESGICVDKCGCLDPEGIPREVNERFEYKCQNCTCDESTKTVTCKPKVCPVPSITNCTGPGFVLVNQTSPSDSCCTSYVCQCRSNTCPVNIMKCPVGYRPTVSVPEGKCCPEHTCDPERVCVHKQIEYQPGASIPGNLCENCTCTNEVDPKSSLLKMTCELLQCEEKCDKGYEYVETDSDICCGRCVQTHCVLNLNDTEHLLPQGETWSPPGNMCEHYTCVKSGETLITMRSHIVCPQFQESNCQPGTIQTAANGCCKTCVEKEKACKLEFMKIHIMHKGCWSKEEVDVPYCEGSCNTFTKYSRAAGAMRHSCTCCKETRYSNRTVDLLCLNGEVVPHTYIHAEECGCRHTDCTTATVYPARKRRSFTLV
ncbi:intestinal mucin-like protein [Thunnus albacares]|uniref:intestinal mucin-like protein n=1 Tax=Thunnus albacares TaxID=8236 RepID=UPI001CF68D50|nr:intestinal mucin-like protein [Thunnus albacares]